MKRAIYITSLFEEIYGKLAIGYHRTGPEGLDALASGKSFRTDQISRGQIFGTGVYMTYDLESQSRPEMLIYGGYLIKVRVNLEKFLIFDKDVARRVYPSSPGILEQLTRIFRVPERMLDRLLHPNMIQKIKNFDSPSSPFTRTEDLAADFWNHVNRRWLLGNVRGVVFTGNEHEGRVILAYDPKSVTPIGWVRAPQGANLRNVKFNRVDEISKETLNPSLTPRSDYNVRSYEAPFKSTARELNQRFRNFLMSMMDTKSIGQAIMVLRFNGELSPQEIQLVKSIIARNFRGWVMFAFGGGLTGTKMSEYKVDLFPPRHLKLPNARIDSND